MKFLCIFVGYIANVFSKHVQFNFDSTSYYFI